MEIVTMKDVLSKRAKDLEKTEKTLYNLEDETRELFAKLWLETDFKAELELDKNPTEKDKTSWIRTNPEYVELKKKVADHKAKQHYQERMFNVCLAMANK